MIWLLVLVLAIVFLAVLDARRKRSVQSAVLAVLPEQFIVFDLETTGLDAERHEIIEIGAVRVHSGSTQHDTYQALVRPKGKVPKKITDITGITQAQVDADGDTIEEALSGFRAFAGDLRLVSFNAEFDMAFLENAASSIGWEVTNPVSCALKMSRRAWPGRKSYRLADLSKDGHLELKNNHRALDDAIRTVVIYATAAKILNSID